MVFRNISKALIVSFVIFISATCALAQTRSRLSSQEPDVNDVSCNADDFATAGVTAEAKQVWEAKTKPTIDLSPTTGGPKEGGLLNLQPLLMAAITQRLGSRYRWGATGPYNFDCSGFVWSIYQSVGITFERSSARTLFGRFSAPAPEEQYKFGTLVFFNGLSHVGVVADENGFYHASRHNGVVYAPFEGYWGKHIDGFRRVPLPLSQVAD